MTDKTLIDILNATSGPLDRIAKMAIEFLETSRPVTKHGPTGPGQDAKNVAELHAFRKKIGYYKPGFVTGLDETIDALKTYNASVHLVIAETEQGDVALWLNGDNIPIGVMIFKKL